MKEPHDVSTLIMFKVSAVIKHILEIGWDKHIPSHTVYFI